MFDPDMIFPIFIVIVCGGGMMALLIGQLITAHRRRKHYEPEDTEPDEPTVVEAELIDKRIDTRRTGSYRFPSHTVIYVLTFAVSEKIEEFEVSLADFERLDPKTRGRLIKNGSHFIDFDVK